VTSRLSVLTGLGLAAAVVAGPSPQARPRILELTVRVELDAVPSGGGPIDVFAPVPREDAHQELLSVDVVSPIPGDLDEEPRYGNRFWHGHVRRGTGEPMELVLRYRVLRRPVVRASVGPVRTPPLSEVERRLFLGPNQRVPVGTRLIGDVLADVSFPGGGPLDEARALYDHVIDTMEYKKVGTGWGNGDTHWACSQRYGNCTDFHALLTSLARTRGIPARFSIGFPIPAGASSGELPGYHCWLDLHLPGAGWFPIDASEAWKHPERRDLLFGSLPADRVAFTVGRDLELGEGHRSGPLNYFVYPHVEVGGERSHGVRTRVAFRTLPAPRSAPATAQ